MVTVSKKREEKLAKLVREFFAVHPDVKLVAITGSAGKASAKIAIGTVLAQQFDIQLRNEEPKAEKPEVQVIVQEFNPKELGYNDWFKAYVVPDITVVTSVTNGRMQVEYSLEEVANEMISLANFSRMAMINRDDIDGRFASFLTNPNITTYGSRGGV